MANGIAPSLALYPAKKALYGTAKTALTDDTKVDVTFGARNPIVNRDWCSVLGGKAEVTLATIPAGGRRMQLDDALTLDVEIGAWTPLSGDAGEQAAQDRAWAIYDTVADYIRTTDVTLGGTVLWCVPGDAEFDGATADEDAEWGCLCIIAATFVAQHRIR